MAKTKPPKSTSAFEVDGLGKTIKELCEEIRKFYLWDEIPWVIGYSGGKDSSAVLQLVWLAVKDIPVAKRKKTIHVISTDTLVEQPIVSLWVDASHAKMRKAADEQDMPVIAHKLSPTTVDTFWVNLIGKGYPKPTNQFRWCTSRMKINPSNNFIRDVIRENGEALLVLGTRKAESQRRARNMSKVEEHSRGAFLDERLSLNVQEQIRELGPPEVSQLELISMAELHEIRRIWLDEKHEFDDSLPSIYEEVTGEPFPTLPVDDKLLGREDWQILKQVCNGDDRMFRLQADLLDVERQFRGMARRAGVYDELMDRLKASQFKDEEEAIELKREEQRRLHEAIGEEENNPHFESQRRLFDDDMSEEIII